MERTIFDEDHEAFRAACREYVTRHLTPNVEQFIKEKAYPRELWLEAGRAGFLGLEIPEEYGGSAAGDYRYNAVFAEELAKVGMAAASCFGIHYDIVAPYLVDLGTEAQKQRWLPGMASGELLSAIGMTEPSGGSDLAALRTTGVRDGDAWVVNGSKTFITNGTSCDLALVAVRTSPEKKARGITLMVFENGMPGYTKGQKLDKVGQTESDTCELFFENVRVSDANVIGDVDMGFIEMMKNLPQERISSGISNLANARQILEETIQYSKDRKAFGSSIGAFQYNKFVIAEMVTQCEVFQAYVDQAIMAHTQGKFSAVDAAKVKWWGAQLLSEVLDRCLQLHGGYGYMNEYRVARAWRDARVTKIWAGTNEIMKELVGRDVGL
ncbi:MAG TPA: acyl-CoA dehydrogenase family protein [Dermatophilaceae bacterium]|nr:acyl-CoA dehydrogenase family protein [Dermatophilaceae bacterium]